MKKKPRVDAAVYKLENQLCFALYTASRAFTRAYQPLLDPLGLTYSQYIVMLVLWDIDDLSVSELGARLELDSGTLTPLLKRLEDARLVARRRDTGDERVVRISLTAAGRALQERARTIPMDLACRAGFSADERGMKELVALRDAVKALTKRMLPDSEATLES